MGVGAGLYMYVVVVRKFTFPISSPDEFLLYCCHCMVNKASQKIRYRIKSDSEEKLKQLK